MLLPGAKLEQSRQCGPLTSFYAIPAPSSPGWEHPSSLRPPSHSRGSCTVSRACGGSGQGEMGSQQQKLMGKNIHLQCRRPGLIPGSGRATGEGKGYPLQCSGRENTMDCIVHGVAKSQVGQRLSLSRQVRPGPCSPPGTLPVHLDQLQPVGSLPSDAASFIRTPVTVD